MTIGDGIAIASVWAFVGAACYSKYITSLGFLSSLLIAIFATYLII